MTSTNVIPKEKTVRLRSAIENDCAAIAEIYRPYVLHTAVTFETEVPSPQEFDRRRTAIQSRAPFLVATADEKIAGYAYAGGHRARDAYQWAVESSVYIGEKFHRQGVARKLYGALFSLLEAQGFGCVLAGIAQPNAASVALHEAMGMKPIAVYPRVGFKAGKWMDVGWWSLSLSASSLDGAAPAPPKFFSIDEVDERLEDMASGS